MQNHSTFPTPDFLSPGFLHFKKNNNNVRLFHVKCMQVILQLVKQCERQIYKHELQCI